jgi:predicted ATPase
MAAGWQGKLLIERGEATPGIQLLSQTLEACERSGWRMCYVQFLAHLAECLVGLGHLDDAGARLERAIAWADRHGEGWYQAELARIKGELILQQSKNRLAVEAENCFGKANEIARCQGALYWELCSGISLARLRMRQGRADEVRQVLAPVYDRFTEGFDTPILRAASTLLNGQSALP